MIDREDMLWVALLLAMVGGLGTVIALAPSGAELDAYAECIDQRRIDARLGEPLRECGPTPRFNSFPDPALAAGSRRAKTPQAVECEASQSGGRQPVTPTPDPLSNTHPNKGEDC